MIADTQYVHVVLKVCNKNNPRSERKEIIWKVMTNEISANSYLEYLNKHECETDEICYRIETWKLSKN